MKKGVVLVMMMITCLGLFAQNMADTSGENVSNNTEPVFTGIKNTAAVAEWRSLDFPSISEYLSGIICYSDEDKDNWIQGVSIVGFTVTAQGNLKDLKVINSVSKNCDKSVIEALKTTNGMWQPATQNGQAIAQKHEVAVRFNLEEGNMKKCACQCYKRALKHYYAGNFKKAVKHFDRAIKYCPYNTGVLYQRGVAKLELGDKEGALADFQRIHDLGDSLADNYLELTKK